MDFYEEFGRRVSSARSKVGLTQEELAMRMGVSRAAIASIETGRQRVNLDLLPKFARFLAVAPMDLLPSIAPLTHPGDLVGELSDAEREMVGRVWKAGARRRRRLEASAAR